MKIKSIFAALALLALPSVSNAAVVTSTNVSGGCANSIAAGVAQIDVFQGASWNSTFANGDAGGSCLFDLNNNSGSVAAVTVAVATVNQNLSAWGFTGGTSLSNPPNAPWVLAQGVAGIKTFTFLIAAGATQIFDWSWGQAYASGGALPEIDFSVFATPVPLPPALLLFGTALAGVGFLGRKKRRKKAEPSLI